MQRSAHHTSNAPGAAVTEAPPARNHVGDSWASGAEQGLSRVASVASHARSPGLVYSVTRGHSGNAYSGLNELRRLGRMRRGVRATSQRHEESYPGFRVDRLMVTLTYRELSGWRGNHIKEYLRTLRRWLERRRIVFRYVWVLELQRRGAAHYHILVWVPRGIRVPMPDRSGMWTHGLSRVELARQPIGYLMKYASKGGDEVELPRGARIYGAGGLTPNERRIVRWAMLPRYVREVFDFSQRVIRARGGGWMSLTTGEWISAAYWHAGGWHVDHSPTDGAQRLGR